MHEDYIREMQEYLIDDIEKSSYFSSHKVRIDEPDSIRVVEEFGQKKLFFKTRNTPQGRSTAEIDFSMFDVITLPYVFLEQIQDGIYKDCEAILDKNGSITIKRGKSVIARVTNIIVDEKTNKPKTQPYILSRNDVVYKRVFSRGLLPMSFYDNDDYDIILNPSKHVEVYNKKLGRVVYNVYVPTNKDDHIIGKFYSLDYSKTIFGGKDKCFSILDVLNYLEKRNKTIYNVNNELDKGRKR